MTNIKFVNIEELDGTVLTHVIIENPDGSYVSMFKSTYDEQQKALDEAKTI